MNHNEDEEAAPQPSRPFPLGREFWIHIPQLFIGEAGYTVENWIASLETTKTLTKLSFRLSDEKQLTTIDRSVMESLCECIANLQQQRHNKNPQQQHHPLCAIKLQNVRLEDEGIYDVVQQLLVAVKQYGNIQSLELLELQRMPIAVSKFWNWKIWNW
jgi:hypothetical protein